MAAKKTGISRDLIIHPGETIADVLEDRNITQAELAARTGVSRAYVNSVISGKKDISSKFAMALEYALDVPKSFWLNLQANYYAELLELNEEATITEGELAALASMKDVVKYLRQRSLIPVGQTKNATVLSLRKAFQISNISNLSSLVATGAFRVSAKTNIDPYVMGAWLRLCQIFGERNSIDTSFDLSRINELIFALKSIMLSREADLQKDLSTILSQYGIKFSVVQNFRGAPVHGFISQDKAGAYQMVLTIRGSYADIFWFSLFHELGHIVNGDVSKTSGFIDTTEIFDTEKEAAADKFASEALLDPVCYGAFLNAGDFSILAIKQFAKKQKVMPYIVIGRLQKEKRIPYTWYSDYKLRYKWAEN